MRQLHEKIHDILENGVLENGTSQHTLPISIRLNLDSALNQPIRRQTRRLQRPQHRARHNGDFAIERREALDEVLAELGALLEAKVGEARVGDRMVLWDMDMNMLVFFFKVSFCVNRGTYWLRCGGPGRGG